MEYEIKKFTQDKHIVAADLTDEELAVVKIVPVHLLVALLGPGSGTTKERSYLDSDRLSSEIIGPLFVWYCVVSCSLLLPHADPARSA